MKTIMVEVEGYIGSGKSRFLAELRERFEDLYEFSEVMETAPGKEAVVLVRKEGN